MILVDREGKKGCGLRSRTTSAIPKTIVSVQDLQLDGGTAFADAT